MSQSTAAGEWKWDRRRAVQTIAVVVGADGEERPRFGSGYLLTPHLVLTAAHVLHGGVSAKVRFVSAPGEVHEMSAIAVFTSPDPKKADVAVLRLEDAAMARVPPVVFGSVVEVVECQALGFPKLTADEDAQRGWYRDSHHAVGRCFPDSLGYTGKLALRVDPPAPDLKGPPWGGMSGAAVFAGGKLVAIVSEHHPSQGLGSLTATRVESWYRLQDKHPGALAWLRELTGLPAQAEELPTVRAEAARPAPDPVTAEPAEPETGPSDATDRTGASTKKRVRRPATGLQHSHLTPAQALYHQWCEALAEEDDTLIGELYHPDAVHVSVHTGHVALGAPQIVAGFADLFHRAGPVTVKALNDGFIDLGGTLIVESTQATRSDERTAYDVFNLDAEGRIRIHAGGSIQPRFPRPVPASSGTPGREFAQRYLDATLAMNANALANLYAPNAVQVGPYGTGHNGRDAIMQSVLQSWRTNGPPRLKPLSRFVEGPGVVVLEGVENISLSDTRGDVEFYLVWLLHQGQAVLETIRLINPRLGELRQMETKAAELHAQVWRDFADGLRRNSW